MHMVYLLIFLNLFITYKHNKIYLFETFKINKNILDFSNTFKCRKVKKKLFRKSIIYKILQINLKKMKNKFKNLKLMKSNKG